MKIKGENKITFVNQNPSITLKDLTEDKLNVLDKAGFSNSRNGQKAKFQREISTEVRPEDFVEFNFRHLSATTVGAGGWQATDFSNEKVLKRAVGMLSGKPAYLNHEMEVGNEIGYVGNTRWTKAYINASGDEIPAGIDGPFILDKVLQPDLVRKMSAPQPYVKSASVAVLFNWEASHSLEDEWDFYWNLGSMMEDDEGNMTMVRRVVTEIVEFYESSLVWLGADPYAGILDANGEVQFIDKGGVSFSKKEGSVLTDEQLNKLTEEYKKDGHFYVAVNSYNQNSNNDMELLKMFAEKIGKKPEEINSEFITQLATDYSKFGSATEELTTLKNEKATWETEKTSLESAKTEAEGKVEVLETQNSTLAAEKTAWEAEKATLESSKQELQTKVETFGKNIESVLEDERKNTIHYYTQFSKGEPNPLILKRIEEETNIEMLKAQTEQFGGEALVGYGATCTKCNSSEHISMRSSKEAKNGGEEDTQGDDSKELDLGAQAHISKNL